MKGQGRWAVAVVVVGSVALMSAAAARDDKGHGWRHADEILQSGELAPPGPILEVQLQFDADASPTLALKRLLIKQGYAPTPDPLQQGYTLTLLNAAGDVLHNQLFEIPIVVSDRRRCRASRPARIQSFAATSILR